MKWFQHHSSAHKNLKFQGLLEKFGWEGYGVYWICCELVAEQGHAFRIQSGKKWFQYLKSTTNIENQILTDLLQELANSNLIDKRSLKKGHLFIPKMSEYADEYSRRYSRQYPDNVGTLSGQARDKLRQDKKRIDKNILSQKNSATEEFDFSSKLKEMEKNTNRHIQIIALYWKYKGIEPENHKQCRDLLNRDLKPASKLTGFSDKRILEVMEWLQNENTFKWTLETVMKYISENLKQIKPITR